MEPQQILDFYSWGPGVCFRHPERGETDTAVVKTLQPRGGPRCDVRACRRCVLAMESERQQAAERAGVNYQPRGNGASPGLP
ncbi:hypothetical protein [Streptomyces sp. NPDC001054]